MLGRWSWNTLISVLLVFTVTCVYGALWVLGNAPGALQIPSDCNYVYNKLVSGQ